MPLGWLDLECADLTVPEIIGLLLQQSNCTPAVFISSVDDALEQQVLDLDDPSTLEALSNISSLNGILRETRGTLSRHER